ncbi:hypothetical protein EAH80_05420 [Mycobacterium hodleri]|uniref:Uncharacterized protein n=1 Tax=Mycolicibacterium hodleri TaxID=49897 RepID=A0A502ELS5_9MYCO|nr:hypothetical protein EAH80_05420 [Mycolicibacterium hodleri]
MAVGLSVPALSDPLPYGPDTCVNGFVWREARSGDTVCVTPATRDQIAAQNANSGANKDPSQASGPQSCSQGYVWREAFDGDTVCVTPAVRSATLADNAAAASRRATNSPEPTPEANTVVFEVTGPGEVFNIVTDPDGGFVPDHTQLPFTRTMNLSPDVHLLQVVATGRNDPGPGCRIILNGKVVAQEPIGGNAHCIFTMPD